MLSDRRETSVPSLLGGWLLHPGQCVRARLPGTRVRALLQVNWLRVFGNAEAARMGQGVWQQLHTRAVRQKNGGTP